MNKRAGRGFPSSGIETDVNKEGRGIPSGWC